MKYIILFAVIVLSSCTKETTNSVIVDSDRNLDKMNAFMNGAIEVDYKHDFRVSKLNNEVPPRVSPLLEERKLIQYASASGDVMLQKYTEVQSTISEWAGQNENDRYTWVIQNTSLKYLRRLFLIENQSLYVSEISFLLKILVNTKSVDLDVLADAFQHCNLNLSSGEQDRYFNYIKKLHDHEIDFIRTNVLKFKEKYDDSTGPEKMKYLAYGKDLERRSKACQYTRDLLGIEITSVD